jgi:hypothetical protein
MKKRPRLRLPERFGGLMPILALFKGVGEQATYPETMAKAGLRFVGHYRIDLLAEHSDKVEVKFALRLFNYSGQNVAGGSVSLTGLLQPGIAYQQLAQVSLNDQNDLELSAPIIVPRHEYQLWMDGRSPRAVLEHIDDDGQPRLEPIELIPSSMVGRLLA